MVITYSFDYDPDEDLLINVDVSSYSRNQIKLNTAPGPAANEQIGIEWNGDSIAGWGKAKLNNFNGYPMINIGWDLYIIGSVIAGGGPAAEKIGLEITFDNGDVMEIYQKAVNGDFYFTYSGSQTQAETKCGDDQGSGDASSLKIVCSISGTDRRFTFFDTTDLSEDSHDLTWVQHGSDPLYTVTSGKSFWVTDLKIHGRSGNSGGTGPGFLGNYLQTVYIETTGTLFTGAIVGFDASIPIASYTLRTALNAGGNAVIVAANPFFEVSTTTLKAQLKKLLTYTNVFGIKQWAGEASTLDIGLHTATYEAGEILRKTMSVEVLDTPVIFSTFLRQWNGLVIEDKDGGFISRGVTNNHLVAFEKADTKVYEGRATRDAFTIVEEDFTSAIVPQQVSNGKDEEMYYKDIWDNIDTDKAHIMIDDNTAGAGSENDPFVVKYPVDLYEKFNNLTNLNKLEINTTISALKKVGDSWKGWSGDDGKYHWYIYNYQSTSFEKVKSLGETELGGDSTTSTVYNTAAFYDPKEISINVIDALKTGVDEWDIDTTYSSGDRAIHEDILYTYIDGTPSSGQEPPDNKWQRTIYDFINYESTAGSADIFSKLNCIIAIECTKPHGIAAPFLKGFWIWNFSVKATFDEDNRPEYSSATINTVAGDGKSITLDATAGINLPEKDGFGVGDIIHIVKNVADYLQDAWDASPINSDVGALTINITGSSNIGVLEDHTHKSFFALLQHISGLRNSTFWANYAATNTVLISSADNHAASGLTLTKADLYNWDESNWSVSYDAKTQKNKIRILGDNVNFIKTISPALDPFDLGDETEIIDDPDIKTLLQASDMADSLTPRKVGSEVIVRLTLDYSNPNQNYSAIKVGNTVILKLPIASDTSIFNDTLLIMAIDLNRNAQTGGNEHATLSLQKRYS